MTSPGITLQVELDSSGLLLLECASDGHGVVLDTDVGIDGSLFAEEVYLFV